MRCLSVYFWVARTSFYIAPSSNLRFYLFFLEYPYWLCSSFIKIFHQIGCIWFLKIEVAVSRPRAIRKVPTFKAAVQLFCSALCLAVQLWVLTLSLVWRYRARSLRCIIYYDVLPEDLRLLHYPARASPVLFVFCCRLAYVSGVREVNKSSASWRKAIGDDWRRTAFLLYKSSLTLPRAQSTLYPILRRVAWGS